MARRRRESSPGSFCTPRSAALLSGQPTLRTLAACGPLGPSCTSYSTFWPSARLRNPSDWMAVWWTNTSLPPASGVMKPKPFASLNHFTVPLGILHSPAQNGAVVWWVTYAAPAPAPSGPGLRSLPQDTGGGDPTHSASYLASETA